MDVEERNDDVILPGFRFHPTDEELVGFYLRSKVQHKSLSIELIKQVDIYKYDPWDLPKIASTGEKEWYFYCPRDRKYRNSARPNRVTGAGFWKATGTDRPIYSSEGSKCIGLKKSLVFYRGRAAKGIKTDWMMHEFRLPSLADPCPPKKLLDKSYPANDAWAICRIFKKTNSMAHRALSQSWVSPLPEATPSHHLPTHMNAPHQNMTFNNDFQHNNTTATFSSQNPEPSLYLVPGVDLPFIFAPVETATTSTVTTHCAVDASSMFLNQQASESISFSGSQDQFRGFLNQQQDENPSCPQDDNVSQWGTIRSMGFPFSLPSDLPWDSPQCPSDMSATYSTNKCYT